jgi:hypothetical protein
MGRVASQRGDGLWCAAVDLGIVNGKRRRKVIYGKTRKEVADKLKALHRDQIGGINIAPDQQTVAQFLDRWLNEVVARRNKPRTHESYADMVRLHIAPYLGTRRLQKLLPEHVLEMMNALTEKGVSPRTVQYARTILVRALNQALKWGSVPRNVASLVDSPRVEPHTIQPLTQQQAQALLLAVRGTGWKSSTDLPSHLACGVVKCWPCGGRTSILSSRSYVLKPPCNGCEVSWCAPFQKPHRGSAACLCLPPWSRHSGLTATSSTISGRIARTYLSQHTARRSNHATSSASSRSFSIKPVYQGQLGFTTCGTVAPLFLSLRESTHALSWRYLGTHRSAPR